MVYRYDADYNGEVVAEARAEGLNSFLGLHYPASDIPAQARALYEKNWIRLISDVDYRPVPLRPALVPSTGTPLDMTFSTLRSVSPIHVEYLQDRKSTRLNSSHANISYAVFCLKKKINTYIS